MKSVKWLFAAVFAIVCMTACSNDDEPKPEPTDGHYGYYFPASVDMFDSNKKRIYHICEVSMLPLKWGNTFPIPTESAPCSFTINLNEGMSFVPEDAIEYTKDNKQMLLDIPETGEAATIPSNGDAGYAAIITRVSESQIELMYYPSSFEKYSSSGLADLKIWAEGEPCKIWYKGNDSEDDRWVWMTGLEKTEEALSLDIPKRIPFQFHPSCFTDVHREHMQGSLHVD